MTILRRKLNLTKFNSVYVAGEYIVMSFKNLNDVALCTQLDAIK